MIIELIITKEQLLYITIIYIITIYIYTGPLWEHREQTKTHQLINSTTVHKSSIQPCAWLMSLTRHVPNENSLKHMFHVLEIGWTFCSCESKPIQMLHLFSRQFTNKYFLPKNGLMGKKNPSQETPSSFWTWMNKKHLCRTGRIF